MQNKLVTPVVALSVDVVTSTSGWSRFWPLYFMNFVKYSTITLNKKLLPTPALPLRNMWYGPMDYISLSSGNRDIIEWYMVNKQITLFII